MRRDQFMAILWMRWRSMVNLATRRGKTGHVLVVVLTVAALLFSILGFLGGLVLGNELLPQAKPLHIMLVWGALSGILLFFWMIGVLTELQRAESMSFQGLLHLPASLLGVHLYNYIGSFVSLSLFCVLPSMLGLATASVMVFGMEMWLLFPLILGFVCLLTAVTYQFRGWLGVLMSDKRKRGNIIALVTISFVMLMQLPNLLNLGHSRGLGGVEESSSHDVTQKTSLSPAETRNDSLARLEKMSERSERRVRQVDTWGTRVSLAVPFGWLAYGARSLREGRWPLALLCASGLFGLGALSLGRSYRTTLRFVTGAESGRAAVASPKQAKADKASGPLFVARELPGASSEVSAIALAGIRGLLRAPEFKLLLMGPAILLLMGTGLYLSGSRSEIPELYAPGLGLGGVLVGLTTMGQMLWNSFGMDRDGFRAYVLSPLARHKILRGKNLAVAPFVIGIGLLPMVALQFVVPTGLLNLLSNLALGMTGFLLMSMTGNLISILAPARMKEGTMQPAQAKFKAVLMQMLALLTLPAIFTPLGLPLLLHVLNNSFGFLGPLPIYPLTSALIFLATAFTYNFVVRRQGDLLQAREQRILDVITRAVD